MFIVIAPANGSWRWTISNCSSSNRACILDLSQIDNETFAIAPPLGIGMTPPNEITFLSTLD